MWLSHFWRYLSSSEKGLKNSSLNGDSNPGLGDASAVLHQLSYQANWEQVVMWVDYKPVDVEIDDHIHSFHSAFQIQILVLSSLIDFCSTSYPQWIISMILAIQSTSEQMVLGCWNFIIRIENNAQNWMNVMSICFINIMQYPCGQHVSRIHLEGLKRKLFINDERRFHGEKVTSKREILVLSF